MNRFNQIYYAAVVSFVFVIAYTSVVGGDEIKKTTSNTNRGSYYRGKRGFFWSNDDNDNKKDATTDSTITAAVNAADGTITTTTTAVTSNKMAATTDGEKNNLVVAGPYLPLVNKLVEHLVPSMSLEDVVTLSVNVAELTIQGHKNYAGAQISSKTTAERSYEAQQTKPDAGTTFGYFTTGIYSKLKDAFGHFGPVPKLSVDGETAESSPAPTESIFDKVKSKMYVVHNFLNGYDAPETETNKNKIETTLTKMNIEGFQSPNTNMIVTKTYESGAETLHKAINGETNHVNIATELIEDGKNVGDKIIQNQKCSESVDSSADEEIEAYDDDEDDDEAENISDDEFEIKEEDFNKALEESNDLQPDFIKTLSGEELLKHLDELQKPLPNLDIESRKVFMESSKTFYFDEDVSEDQVNELVNALVKATNYFISTALENDGIFRTRPMNVI